MRKYFLRTFVFILAVTFLWSCRKTNEGDRYTVSGNGSGSQEVPAVTTPGTVTVTGTYRAKDKELTYNVSYNNLSGNPTMMHFHGPADLGVNADVLIPVTGFSQAVSGNFSGSVMLTTTSTQESALLAGKLYFNVHTVKNPGGEVRAQIGVQRVN